MKDEPSDKPQEARDGTRATPRQEPAKTYVVNTDGVVRSDHLDKDGQPANTAPTQDLKRQRHFRNVMITLVGVLVAVLVVLALVNL